MRVLAWFRADLRAGDNTALRRASERARAASGNVPGHVVGLFVVSPGEWIAHDYAPARVDLMLRSVGEVSRALASRGIPLLVAHARRAADVPGIVLGEALRHRCAEIHFNREHGVDEADRDERVSRLAARAGIEAIAHVDQTILAPDAVRTKEGRAYTVFTPFRRAWFRALEDRGGARALPPPLPQPPTGIAPSPIPASVRGFTRPMRVDLWPAGERHARSRLARFAAARLGGYHERRDVPALAGTSALSPYLAIGAISPRRCLIAALRANGGRAEGGRRGPATWINELIWREFFVHVMESHPRVSMGRPLRRGAEPRWREDDAGFEAWCTGRTGYPFVDAGMRQLAATGWMHNRVRMVVSMFLCKHLLIDWRRGERHFMRHLADGFFASNNGGWQWSASTGADAAPYFRVFNPTLQGRRFDPRGEYIRRWVPELAGVRGDAVHAPHDPASGLTRSERAALDYPPPIVDHERARARAFEAYRGR